MTFWLTADPVQSATLRRGERPRRGHRCEPRSKRSPPRPEAGGEWGLPTLPVDPVRVRFPPSGLKDSMAQPAFRFQERIRHGSLD